MDDFFAESFANAGSRKPLIDHLVIGGLKSSRTAYAGSTSAVDVGIRSKLGRQIVVALNTDLVTPNGGGG